MEEHLFFLNHSTLEDKLSDLLNLPSCCLCPANKLEEDAALSQALEGDGLATQQQLRDHTYFVLFHNLLLPLPKVSSIWKKMSKCWERQWSFGWASLIYHARTSCKGRCLQFSHYPEILSPSIAHISLSLAASVFPGSLYYCQLFEK